MTFNSSKLYKGGKMDFRITRMFISIICIYLFAGCAPDSSHDPQAQSRIKGIVDGGAVQPPNTIPNLNPRYPDLKTYVTSNLGYYSVISAIKFTLSVGQAFFASALLDSNLYIAIERTDANYFKWIDIYKVISSNLNFTCSIRDDGNFKAELDIDQSTIYITNNTYPSKIRSFNLSNCQEGISLLVPTVTSPWNNCAGWKMLAGELYGCYYSSNTGRVVRKYNFNTSSMTTLFSESSWSDFKPSFSSSSWAVNSSKVYGIQKITTSYPVAIYLIDNVGYSAWAKLPSDDYPDLAYNYSTQYYIHTSDSKTAQIVLADDTSIKIFSLDITSF